MKLLDLSGDHHEMGRQHGFLARRLRPQIQLAITEQLDTMRQRQMDFEPYALELREMWERIARPTLDMLRGISEALSLDWESFFRYTIASYLNDRALVPAASQGCTCWAATAPITQDGNSILVKNRDYRPTHQDLQCLARAHPAHGYRYIYVTSAGSPGVFSSGMNETGLAVVDTHVMSLDMGPGLTRYSVMMEILEHHHSVSSALDYLNSIPHLGNGTLTLLDAHGEMVVFETGHKESGVLLPQNGWIVSTNHYVSTQLRHCWVDRSPPDLQGNTLKRYSRIWSAIQAAQGQVDVPWAKALMASHAGPLGSICRHADIDPKSVTLSTVIYAPEERRIHLSDGLSCKARFQTWRVF